MSMTCFLEVNGSLRGSRKEKWFQLPATGMAARSLRFGNHALVVNDTMQILPIGDTRRLRLGPQHQLQAESSRTSRMAALISNSKLFALLM